jgi:hypothetical protein
VASFVSVNPQIPGWRLFLAEVQQSITKEEVNNEPGKPPSVGLSAAKLILADAGGKLPAAEERARRLLRERVVNPANELLDGAAGDAFVVGKTTVAAAMDRAKDGTAKGRTKALGDLVGFFEGSWKEGNKLGAPIKVTFPR